MDVDQMYIFDLRRHYARLAPEPDFKNKIKIHESVAFPRQAPRFWMGFRLFTDIHGSMRGKGY